MKVQVVVLGLDLTQDNELTSGSAASIPRQAAWRERCMRDTLTRSESTAGGPSSATRLANELPKMISKSEIATNQVHA